MNDPKTTDAISRSAVLAVGNVRKVVEYDEAGYDMTYLAVPVNEIEKFPALDVAPVVHDKDIRSSVITVKDSDEWQDRIILADESTQVCAVYYADDSELMPVVHARWIPYDEARPGMYFSHRCSNCGGSVEHAYLMRPSSFSDFCPNCGARMDGEAQ